MHQLRGARACVIAADGRIARVEVRQPCAVRVRRGFGRGHLGLHIAQFLIATPIVIAFTTASFQALAPRLPDLLTVLGAGRLRTLWLLAREARLGLLAAVMAGLTWWTASGWPDILLGLIIIGLNVQAAREVWQVATEESLAVKALAGEDIDDD